MKTTPQEEWEEEIRGDRYEETGIYHVDGAEYNVDEDKLVAFIKSEKEKSRQEERAELAIKTDVELRRILAEELPKLEKKVRQEVLREAREKIEGIDKTQHICRFNDGEQKCDCYYKAFADLLSTLESKE